MLISLCSNVARMAGMATGLTEHWWPWFNISDPKSVTLQDYREWYSHYGSLLESNITDCDLEREMSKVGFTYMLVLQCIFNIQMCLTIIMKLFLVVRVHLSICVVPVSVSLRVWRAQVWHL